MRGGVVGVPGAILTSSRNRLCSGVDRLFGVAGVVVTSFLFGLYFRGGLMTKGSAFSFWLDAGEMRMVTLDGYATCQ